MIVVVVVVVVVVGVGGRERCVHEMMEMRITNNDICFLASLFAFLVRQKTSHVTFVFAAIARCM
jgi:hypothetical protein